MVNLGCCMDTNFILDLGILGRVFCFVKEKSEFLDLKPYLQSMTSEIFQLHFQNIHVRFNVLDTNMLFFPSMGLPVPETKGEQIYTAPQLSGCLAS